MKTRKILVTMPDPLIAAVANEIDGIRFKNRSHLISIVLKEFIEKEKSAEETGKEN